MATRLPLPVRRLTAEPPTVASAQDLYAGLFADIDLPVARPYCVISMITSVDGHATRKGLSGSLADDRADREIFLSLRNQVDAVLAGTQTIAAERYRRLIPEPQRRDARAAAGLAPEPLAVILSRSGDLALGASSDTSQDPAWVGLLEDPEQRRAIYTGPDAEPRAAFADLRTTHGIRTLLCEGGPRMNAALLAAGLVDELLLTVSPVLLGGDPTAIVGGPPLPTAATLELVSVSERGGSLFVRYRVAAASGRLVDDG